MVWDVWQTLVQGYGNLAVATTFTWPVLVQPLLTASMGAPLQIFLIYRCCKFMSLRWYYALPLCAILFVAYITALVDSVQVITFDFNVSATSPGLPTDPTKAVFLTWLYSSAALDIIITAALMFYLLKHRANVQSPRLNKLLVRVVNVTWETALPPCAVAILVCILHQFSEKPETVLWAMAAIFVLGKLYALSLFFTLNFRCDVKSERGRGTGHLAVDITNLSSVRPPMDTSIRVNVHTLKHSELEYIDVDIPDGESLQMAQTRSSSDKSAWRSPRRHGTTWESKVGSNTHFAL